MTTRLDVGFEKADAKRVLDSFLERARCRLTGPPPLSRRRTEPLEVTGIEGLPDHAVPAFEAAFQTICATVAYFLDDDTGTWRIEGVREAGAGNDELTGALALAALMAGDRAARAASRADRGRGLAGPHHRRASPRRRSAAAS